MYKSHSFTDKNKTLVMSHKEHGGMRIRIVTHKGHASEKVDFFLTADEVEQFKTAMYRRVRGI